MSDVDSSGTLNTILREDKEVKIKYNETLDNIRSVTSTLRGLNKYGPLSANIGDSDRLDSVTRVNKRANANSQPKNTKSMAFNDITKTGADGHNGFEAFTSIGTSKFRLRSEYRKVYRLIENVQRAFSILAESVVSPDDYSKKSIRVSIDGADDTGTDTVATELRTITQRLIDKSGLLDSLTKDLEMTYVDGAQYYAIIPVDEVLDKIRSNDDNNTKIVLESFNDNEVKKLFKPKDTIPMYVETEDADKNKTFDIGGGFKHLNHDINKACVDLEGAINNNPQARDHFNKILSNKLDKNGQYADMSRKDIRTHLDKGVKDISDAIKVYDIRSIFALDIKTNTEMESFLDDNNAGITEMEASVFDSLTSGKLDGKSKLKRSDILGLDSLSASTNSFGETDDKSGGTNLADALIASNDDRDIKGSLIKKLDVDTVFPVIYKGKCYGYIHMMDVNTGLTMGLVGGSGGSGIADFNTTGGSNNSFFDSLATTFNGRSHSLGTVQNNNQTDQLRTVRDIAEKAIITKIIGKDIPYGSEGSMGDKLVELLYEQANSDKNVGMVFIPTDNMIEYSASRDKSGYPTSLLDSSLFINLVYISLRITDIMNRIDRSNDRTIWDVEVGELSTDIQGIVSNFMKEVQGTEVSINDVGSVDSIFNKLGNNTGNLFTAKQDGKSVFDVNTLPGQDYNAEQLNYDDYAQGVSHITGVPAAAMNMMGEDEFARSIRVQLGSFLLKVLEYQKDPSSQLTKAGRILTLNELLYRLRNAESTKSTASTDGEVVIDEEAAKTKDDDEVEEDTRTEGNGVDEVASIRDMIGRVRDIMLILPPPATLQAQNSVDIIQTLTELTTGFGETFINRAEYDTPELYDSVMSIFKGKLGTKLYGHTFNIEQLDKLKKEAESEAREIEADKEVA